jgi:4-carboxymuconolactone decarboxylase
MLFPLIAHEEKGAEGMEESKDMIAPHIDQNPDFEARAARAHEIRKSMGIYGKGGQGGRRAWKRVPTHAQIIFEYCFGMAWGQPLLDLKHRELIVVTALATQQLDDEVEWHIRSALNLGWTQEEVLEALTTLSPYIGLPKTNHAMRAAFKVFDERDREAGIAPEDTSQPDPELDAAEAKGDRLLAEVDLKPDMQERVQKAFEVRQKLGIYGTGGQAHDGFYTISKAHNQVIFEYCFGVIWNQPLLDLKTKEMLVIAASTVNQCDNELEWHVRSALNVGLTRDEIIEVITQCSPYIGLSKTNQGLRAAKRSFDALDGKGD